MLGPVIAKGSRSNVHAFGPHAVAKVPLVSMPAGWIRFEADYTAAVRAVGGPAPRVIGIEVVDGHEAAIFERVDGPSMWDAVNEHPERAARYGHELAELHASLFQLPVPISLPSRAGRLACKIRDAARDVDTRLLDVVQELPARALRPVLCHGDLHPKNVILSPNGPVLVDWFDAARGDPLGDVARVSLLLSAPHGSASTAHLPGASGAPANKLIGELLDAYLARIQKHWPFTPAALHTWRRIEAAARLAEGVEQEPLLAVLAS